MVHVTYNTRIYLHTHMKGCTSLFAKLGSMQLSCYRSSSLDSLLAI